jgi:putative hydrolase of the HAD superfamily
MRPPIVIDAANVWAFGASSVNDLSTVVFDLDDTLVVDDRSVTVALFATCSSVVEACPERLFKAVWHHAHERWRSIESIGPRANVLGVLPLEALMSETIAHDIAGTTDYHQHVWSHAFADVRAKRQASIFELSKLLRREAMARYRLYPYVRETLDALRKRYTTALLTNGPSCIQREKLCRLQLRDKFEVIVISTEVGKAKPDPEVFQVVLNCLSASPAEAVMVGNDQTNDVSGARAVGMGAIHLQHDAEIAHQAVVGVPAIKSIAELPAVLQTACTDSPSTAST